MKPLDQTNIMLNSCKVNNKDNSMAPIEIVLVFFIALEIVESGVFSVSYVLALELKTEI